MKKTLKDDEEANVEPLMCMLMLSYLTLLMERLQRNCAVVVFPSICLTPQVRQVMLNLFILNHVVPNAKERLPESACLVLGIA